MTVKTSELAEQIERYGYFRIARKIPRIRLTIFTPDEDFARRLAADEGRKLYRYDYSDDPRPFFAVPFEVRDTVRITTRCLAHFCQAHKFLAVNLAAIVEANERVRTRSWTFNVLGRRRHAYEAAVIDRDALAQPTRDFIAEGGLHACPNHVPYIRKTRLDRTKQNVVE